MTPNIIPNLWRIVDPLAVAARDRLLRVIRHRRIKLGEWPDRGIVAAAVEVITELGGKRIEKDIGFGFDIDILYFKVCGRRVRLVVEEYGDVSLWGAKGVVSEISSRIKERLSARNMRAE